MSQDRKRSTAAHPDVVKTLQQIRAGEVVPGIHEFHAADREDLINSVAAVDRSDADVTIMVDGLSASTLGLCSESICDLVVETKVPLVFRHRGDMLQLTRLECWPPTP